MKVAYPTIFTDVGNNILIEVPDLGILTEANEEGKRKGTMAEAIMMARDAIGIKCIRCSRTFRCVKGGPYKGNILWRRKIYTIPC